MKKTVALLAMLVLFGGLIACGNHTVAAVQPDTTVAETPTETQIPQTQIIQGESVEETEVQDMTERKIEIIIGETQLTATLENNASADALLAYLEEGTLQIEFSQYGGFEQVGNIGKQLPSEDVQMTTQAGDIVLYGGDKMVIFYGSNAWSYTRLGKLEQISASDLQSILGNGDVTAEISCLP